MSVVLNRIIVKEKKILKGRSGGNGVSIPYDELIKRLGKEVKGLNPSMFTQLGKVDDPKLKKFKTQLEKTCKSKLYSKDQVISLSSTSSKKYRIVNVRTELKSPPITRASNMDTRAQIELPLRIEIDPDKSLSGGVLDLYEEDVEYYNFDFKKITGAKHGIGKLNVILDKLIDTFDNSSTRNNAKLLAKLKQDYISSLNKTSQSGNSIKIRLIPDSLLKRIEGWSNKSSSKLIESFKDAAISFNKDMRKYVKEHKIIITVEVEPLDKDKKLKPSAEDKNLTKEQRAKKERKTLINITCENVTFSNLFGEAKDKFTNALDKFKNIMNAMNNKRDMIRKDQLAKLGGGKTHHSRKKRKNRTNRKKHNTRKNRKQRCGKKSKSMNLTRCRKRRRRPRTRRHR